MRKGRYEYKSRESQNLITETLKILRTYGEISVKDHGTICDNLYAIRTAAKNPEEHELIFKEEA